MAEWIEQCVRPGMTVVDIGANHGLYTEQLATAVGPTGQVFAIEPQVTLAEELRANGPHVTVLTLAVGDHDGWASLHLSAAAEHASLYPANVLQPTGKIPIVPLRTLDSLQATGEIPRPIHAIKMDTQGAEAAILLGAETLLRTQQPALYLEIWPFGLTQAGTSVQALCETLEALGYAPHGQTWDQVLTSAAGCAGHGSNDVLFCEKGES